MALCGDVGACEIYGYRKMAIELEQSPVFSCRNAELPEYFAIPSNFNMFQWVSNRQLLFWLKVLRHKAAKHIQLTSRNLLQKI